MVFYTHTLHIAMIPLVPMLLSQHCLLITAILTYSCMPCLVHMSIMSAMPKYHSKFLIAFYAHLVSFSNIRSILSNRTYTTEFIVLSHARFNVIRQHYSLIWRIKVPYQIIYCIKYTLTVLVPYYEKMFSKMKNVCSGTQTTSQLLYCLHFHLLGTPVDVQWVV